MSSLRVLALVGLAVVLRLWLLRQGAAEWADRVETNTAGASIHALREGLFLRSLGLSPYGVGSLLLSKCTASQVAPERSVASPSGCALASGLGAYLRVALSISWV
jgi:hypothetical protein